MAILYKLSVPHPVSHYVEIEMRVTEIEGTEILFQLSSWRPGRYELANFAKNIRKWKAYSTGNEALPFRKIRKDCWSVSADGAKEIVIKYDYHCSQLDAGACWVDDEQIYINPVHCFLFLPDRMHEECIVELSLPSNYRIATSLQKSGERRLLAENYEELADSPFIASANLQIKSYEARGVNFSIAIQGDAQPDWIRILADFKAFSEKQIDVMGDFPSEDYIFLVQVLPHRFYHGVEHLRSTVLAVGPGAQFMNDSVYIDFIGVASHELYHAWNVKTIRPAEMMPYDYSKENYSQLGYVYEGVTTYYGDQMLARADVFSIEQFFIEINVRLQKHFDNPARLNLSVADSSFDTWLDGYVPGVPGRKTSIYDEGCLIAMMTDLMIRKNTNHGSSLDTVMQNMYVDFGKRKRGYTDHDYISLVSHCAGVSLADFFIDFVYGTEDDTEMLVETLGYAGLDLLQSPSTLESERFFGFKVTTDSRSTRVTTLFPDSPAFRSGLGKDDEIIAVNERKVEDNLQEFLLQSRGERVVLTVLTPLKKLKDITIENDHREYYPKYSIVKKAIASEEQKKFFKQWLEKDF